MNTMSIDAIAASLRSADPTADQPLIRARLMTFRAAIYDRIRNQNRKELEGLVPSIAGVAAALGRSDATAPEAHRLRELGTLVQSLLSTGLPLEQIAWITGSSWGSNLLRTVCRRPGWMLSKLAELCETSFHHAFVLQPAELPPRWAQFSYGVASAPPDASCL